MGEYAAHLTVIFGCSMRPIRLKWRVNANPVFGVQNVSAESTFRKPEGCGAGRSHTIVSASVGKVAKLAQSVRREPTVMK